MIQLGWVAFGSPPGQPEKVITCLHAELRRQLHCLPEHRVVRPGDLLVRVDRVAVARQRADDEPAAGDGVLERLQLLLALQQLGRLAVAVARIGARADLDGLEAELLHVVERCFKWLVAEENREDPDLHNLTLSDCRLTIDDCRLRIAPIQTVTQRFVTAAFSIASSTFWLRTPSSKFGVGTLSFAIASSRSYTVWMNVCS